jgi:hypothetical protein
MARSIDTIFNAMVVAKDADSNLSELDSNSKVAIWRLWFFIVAAAINALEQLQDIFQANIELTASKAVAGTAPWVQDRTLKFQHDDTGTNPQIALINDDFSFGYPVIDSSYLVVTRCSVTTGVGNLVSILVARDTSATDTTPIQLTSNQEVALDSYWKTGGVEGITYNVVNKASDKIGITATVYYQGQYATSISADVDTAINAYLAGIDFAGKISISKIEDAIQDVAGVDDYKLDIVTCRDDATSYASGIKIYDLSSGVNLRFYSPIAGYIIEEDTAGFDFDTTITYIAQ